MMKCSVQIVDLSGESPQHVRKITLHLSGREALEKVLPLLSGHMVGGKTRSPKPAIGAEKPRTLPVKG